MMKAVCNMVRDAILSWQSVALRARVNRQPEGENAFPGQGRRLSVKAVFPRQKRTGILPVRFWRRLGDFVRTQRKRRSRSGTFPDLLFDIFYIRLGKALRGELFLEVVCNDHMVTVPDDFPYKSIHEQFANLDVVGILKDFGEQELLHFLDGQVSV